MTAFEFTSMWQSCSVSTDLLNEDSDYTQASTNISALLFVTTFATYCREQAIGQDATSTDSNMSTAAGARCHGDELRSPWRQLHSAVGDQRRSAAAAGRSAWLWEDRLSRVDGCPRRPATRIPQQHWRQVHVDPSYYVSFMRVKKQCCDLFACLSVVCP